MQSPQNLIWIDLEMTGLEPEHDVIIEMATIVTDSELNILATGPVIAVHQSDALLTQLVALAKVPEFQARLRWEPNTLAIWDNRSTQHYAVGDYFPQHRKLHRITNTSEKTLLL